jgi:Fe-S cluster biogenesis protein NfuA
MSDQAQEQIVAALSDLRDALQADGADLAVVGVDGPTVRVRLIVGPETCHECIMPKDFLEEVLLMRLREHFPEISCVQLEDPRLG